MSFDRARVPKVDGICVLWTHVGFYLLLTKFIYFDLEFIDRIMETWTWDWLSKPNAKDYELLPLDLYIRENKLSLKQCLQVAIGLARHICTLHERNLRQVDLSAEDVSFRRNDYVRIMCITCVADVRKIISI